MSNSYNVFRNSYSKQSLIKIKLSDELFEKLLDYYYNFFAAKKKDPDTDMKNLLTELCADNFPASDLTTFYITDKQYKKILDYCFSEKYQDYMKDYFLSKYAFAFRVFNYCISSKNAERKPTKRDIKMYSLYLDMLIKTGLSFSDISKCNLIHRTSYFGLGKLTMDYLNKLDIFPEEEKLLNDLYLDPNVLIAGFSYRGYDNARIFNCFLEYDWCDEIRDVFDLEKYKLPDNFPYAIKGAKSNDDN